MKKLRLILGLTPFLTLFLSGVAWAQYSSSNYKSNEVFFGTGGDNGQASANYKAQASVGALGVDRYFSTNYQTYSGFLTPNEPFLEMQIDTASPVNLGTLDTATTRTGTATFHVRAYINSGYTVQTISQPPKYTSGSQSHTLTAMSTRGSSVVNTEQFGINLMGNTSPATFGADPSPQPSQTFATTNGIANGVAAPGYDLGNQYKYNAGDVIACSGTHSGGVSTCGSVSGWGLTVFTISYIANITNFTPAGSYSMTQDLVIVATF
ncbi:MAG: hypothetical protein ACREGG_04275 [Candidatus Saccharimonadales bacterium]